MTRHHLWPEAVSLLEPSLVAFEGLLEAGQLTDSHHLVLVVHHGGQLVTLDRRLTIGAVVGAGEELLLIDL